jgi:hypothetical protein
MKKSAACCVAAMLVAAAMAAWGCDGNSATLRTSNASSNLDRRERLIKTPRIERPTIRVQNPQMPLTSGAAAVPTHRQVSEQLIQTPAIGKPTVGRPTTWRPTSRPATTRPTGVRPR